MHLIIIRDIVSCVLVISDTVTGVVVIRNNMTDLVVIRGIGTGVVVIRATVSTVAVIKDTLNDVAVIRKTVTGMALILCEFFPNFLESLAKTKTLKIYGSYLLVNIQISKAIIFPYGLYIKSREDKRKTLRNS